MIKYFCNICKSELTEYEIKYSLEMVGYGHYCQKHYPKQSNQVFIYKTDLHNKTYKELEKFLDMQIKKGMSGI